MTESPSTERLRAEPLSLAHADELAVLHADEHVMNATMGGTKDRRESREWMERNLRHGDDGGLGVFVFRDRETGRFAGLGLVRPLGRRARGDRDRLRRRGGALGSRARNRDGRGAGPVRRAERPARPRRAHPARERRLATRDGEGRLLVRARGRAVGRDVRLLPAPERSVKVQVDFATRG